MTGPSSNTHGSIPDIGLSSLQDVLAIVRERIVPTPLERRFMSQLCERLTGELEEILASSGIQAKVSLQGSVAHDTWLRGEHDVDIFAEFPEGIDRRVWKETFLPAIRRAFKEYRKVERYAEHPYLELLADNHVRVNIVPCYAVEKGQWKSATDRSPYHSKYLKEHLTVPLQYEARLLKKFLRGIQAYGAEIRVGGFSGMLVETLALHFQTFASTLEEASGWTEPVFIDPEKHSNLRKFKSGFVVVDPVDPDRNLAAAVRPENMWSFVAAAREFLKAPRVSFFQPSRSRLRGRAQLLRLLKGSHHDLVAIKFPHPRLIVDVLWGQIFRLERALVGTLERSEFHVIRSRAWSNEDRLGIVLMEVSQAILPRGQVHYGPPVSKRAESDEFLRKHGSSGGTVVGPWVNGGRWIVERERDVFKVKQLIKKATEDTRYGFAVPRQINRSFRRGARVLLNDEVLSLLGHRGFGEALWEFLDGRPAWLRSSRR